MVRVAARLAIAQVLVLGAVVAQTSTAWAEDAGAAADLDLSSDDEPLDPTPQGGAGEDGRERKSITVGRGETTGWLVVTSEPAGLDVTVNGKMVGRTPLFDHELEPGTYVVGVADRCYDGKKRPVVIRKQASTAIDVKATSKQAGVQVSAEDELGHDIPALFFVDGRKVGAAPASFKIPLCAAFLALQREGVGRWSGHVELDERKVTAVRGVLRAANLLPSVPTPPGYTPIAMSVFEHLEKDYIEPSRANPSLLVRGALEALSKRVSGLKFGPGGEKDFHVTFGSNSTDLAVAATLDLTELAESMDRVLKLFTKDPLETWSAAALELTLLNGALASLSDDSRVLTRAEAEAGAEAGRVSGQVGLEVLSSEGALRVTSVLEESPAAEAGIRAGDLLRRIGDEDVTAFSRDQVVSALAGEVGSEVAVSVERRGWVGPRRFVLRRAVVEGRMVEARRLSGDVGYVRVRAFDASTNKDLGDQVARLGRKKKLRGLVLDLRDNVRGALEVALPVADRFLAQGDLVTRVTRSERNVVLARAAGDDITELPLIVLVSLNTASSAEVVAGALQGLNRALLIGEPTRGHASLVTTFPLAWSFSLRLRTGQYLTAGGRKFEGEGIRPDVFLIPSGVEREDSEARSRAQHDRAVETIRYSAAADRHDQDYPLDLARALLVRVGAVEREAMRRQAHALLERERARQKSILTGTGR